MERNKEPAYGCFGNLSGHYVVGRREYPEELFRWLYSLIDNPTLSVLDVGCGTGISTRQLMRSGATVVGCDIDRKMLDKARKEDDIAYVVAKAEHLPFRGKQFDVVTAFGAFHWFANRDALEEIKRVLKPKGVFFVANKNDSGGFKRGYKAIIRDTIQKDLPEIKKEYQPASILSLAGFYDIRERNISVSEYCTLTQALHYLQSASIWNEVPDDKKPQVRECLEQYCINNSVNDHIEVSLRVEAVAGYCE